MFVSSFHKLHSFQFTDWWTFPSTLCSHFLHLNIFTLGCVFSDWKPKNYEPKEISGPSPFFFFFNVFFGFFILSLVFVSIFEGVALQLSGCSSVLLLFTNFPIYFRNSQNFHQFISNPPGFNVSLPQCNWAQFDRQRFPKCLKPFSPKLAQIWNFRRFTWDQLKI